MRKLMLSTAMVLPLMLAPSFAQDTATTPAEGATDTMTTPMGAETEPAADATTMDTAPAAPGADGEVAADAEMEADAADAEADTAAVAASGKVEQEQAQNELRIDWITDTTVNAPDGTAIGDVNDVIIDDTGMVKAVIVGVGGFLGIGEKQIALPWDRVMINYDAQEMTSDLTKEEAEAAPEYVFREQDAAPAADGTAATAPASDPAMGTAPATGTDAAAPAATDPAAAPAATDATAPADAPAAPAAEGEMTDGAAMEGEAMEGEAMEGEAMEGDAMTPPAEGEEAPASN